MFVYSVNKRPHGTLLSARSVCCMCAVPLCRWFGKRSSKLNHMKWKQVEQTIKTEARINIQWCIINENFSVNGELLPISKSNQEKYRTANWKRNIERARECWLRVNERMNDWMSATTATTQTHKIEGKHTLQWVWEKWIDSRDVNEMEKQSKAKQSQAQERNMGRCGIKCNGYGMKGKRKWDHVWLARKNMPPDTQEMTLISVMWTFWLDSSENWLLFWGIVVDLSWKSIFSLLFEQMACIMCACVSFMR